MTPLTDNFTREELACRCGVCDGGSEEYLLKLAERLEQVRQVYLKPMRVNSGFRCLKHPVEAAKGPEAFHSHTFHYAADIAVSGADALDLTVAALECGFWGIGWSQKGEHAKRFVHIDFRDQRGCWSY